MRTKHNVRTLGHLVDFLDEDGAPLFELRHDMDVVHDLLTHIHRSAIALQCLLDGDNRTINTRTIAARSGQQHTLGTVDRTVLQPFASRTGPTGNTG